MQAQKLFNLPLRPLRGRNLYRRGGKRALDFSATALGRPAGARAGAGGTGGTRALAAGQDALGDRLITLQPLT